MDRSTSLLKALDLLTVLGGTGAGATVQELALTMNLPRTTVIRILNTIMEYGLVQKVDRIYQVTRSFGDWCRPDRNVLHCQRYRPVLEAWARATGELVLLGQLEGAGVVHLDFVESDHRVRVAPAPTTRHNIRHNALGKLFLSQRPDLAAAWVARDANFADELETIRETGIAWNHEETVAGMVALACHGFERVPTEPKLAVAWPEARFSKIKAERAVRALQKIFPRFA